VPHLENVVFGLLVTAAKSISEKGYKAMALKVKEVDPSIAKLVKQNDGYCPCAVDKTPDTKCMCKEFRDQKEPGICHCGRYEKV
jgi:hypothetical protein